MEIIASDGKRWALVREFGEIRLFVGSMHDGQPFDGASAALRPDDVELLKSALVDLT